MELYQTKIHSQPPRSATKDLDLQFIKWLQANFTWLQLINEFFLPKSAAPMSTDVAQTGAIWIDTSAGNLYVNKGTALAPTWTQITIP